jgi:hypothetical protein
MKTVLLVTVTLFLSSLTVFAQSTYDKATVTGTVQTGVAISLGNPRIVTEPLNNKRIFQEFAVSPIAYELVLNPATFELLLLPKHTNSGLPTLSVFAPGDTLLGLLDGKARLGRYFSNFALSANTNLFKNLSGEMVIVRYYKGTVVQDFVYKKTVINALAQSEPPRSGDNTTFLKFKVATSGGFTQAP